MVVDGAISSCKESLRQESYIWWFPHVTYPSRHKINKLDKNTHTHQYNGYNNNVSNQVDTERKLKSQTKKKWEQKWHIKIIYFIYLPSFELWHIVSISSKWR